MKKLQPSKKGTLGVTLIEIMAATAILTVVMGMLVSLGMSFGDTAEVQDIKITASGEARRAMLTVTPQLRQSARMSINWADLPGESITYQVADDVDGNGSAVGIGGAVELSDARTIQRDVDDLNDDGISSDQLILINGATLRVLANNLNPLSEILDAQGVLVDTNGNGRRDQGFWIEQLDQGLLLTIETIGITRRGHIIPQISTGFILPRN
jgi:hypothetical protein